MWRPFSNAIEIRQSIRGGCADESQGEESQGYDDCGRSTRSPVKCRGPVFRVLFIQRLSHLRSLRGQVSRKMSSPWTNKRAVVGLSTRRSCAVAHPNLSWIMDLYD